MSELILYDRSRVTTDWKCPRARYLGYEILGQGIAPTTTSLELYLGTAVHDGLAAIAHMQKDGVPTSIDEIAETAKQQMLNALLPATAGEVDDEQFAHEQATLVEGLLRGFHKHVWPKLMATYPEIVCIEQEMHYDHDGLRFMSRPDLVLRNNDGLWYCVAPETKLLTKDLNWVSAEFIKKGDILVGVEEDPLNAKDCKDGTKRRQARHWNTGKVLRTKRLIKPSYRLRLSDGTSLTCSDDHMWLVPNERAKKKSGGTLNATWKKTNDIKIGTKLLKVVQPWTGSEVDEYDKGYLAAAWEGEGSLSQRETSRSIHTNFSQRKNVMMEQVTMMLDRNHFSWKMSKNGGGKNKDVFQAWICGKPEVLRFLGIIRPQRLLDKLNIDGLGGSFPITNDLRVVEKEFLGDQEVIAIETSNHTFIAEGIVSHNCEYKTTSSKKEGWINSWETAVQLHSSIRAIESTLGEKVTGVIVQGLYKGYESYGKQNSPFCYSYFKAGTPPFNHNTYSYDYKPGFKKYPVWQMEGGLKEWIEKMPPTILIEQFPQTPPIFVKDDLINNFFEQRKFREHEINLAKTMLEAADEVSSKGIIDTAFPQRFDQCQPGWGSPCQFRRICHGSVADPLQSGYELRVPHHQEEVDKYAKS